MIGKASILSITLSVMCSGQFYPLPYPGQPFQGAQQQPPYGAPPQQWQPSPSRNYSNPIPNAYASPPYSYPSPQAYPDPRSSDNIPPNQYYGIPPPATSGYPQIYKIDNLIIIANPPPQQPQPCIPQQRPPPQFPNPNRPPGDDRGDDVLNRLPEDEPSKCTWAIVACCSPDNVQVRYNCFELLGCPGFFFDNSPCDPKIVMAAANAALEFYRSAGNSTSTAGSNGNNSSTNRI